ncbi:MAG: serine protease [Pseudomonadota bacterium]
MRCWFRAALGALSLICSFPILAASAQLGMERFADQYGQIFQIRDVASSASSKSSIGSGFQVSADGLIVTNFHVVSSYVNAPDSRQLEYLDQQGNSGPLTLIDFDVINDLAVLRHPEPADAFFPLAQTTQRKGELIYALGNPHDFGITLVFGANNGMVEHSYDPQILFSGSLNPGMSGGPGLNEAGEVVGVNVATAGSQLSFLVPLAALEPLLAAGRELTPERYEAEITGQIKRWQQARYADLLARPWPRKSLGEHQVLSELRQDFQCWGNSNESDSDANVRSQRTSCTSGNSVYLNGRLNTGQIHYSFDNEIALDLSSYRFHRVVGNQALSADNAAGKDDVTPYQCSSRFLEDTGAPLAELQPLPLDGTSAGFIKASYCVRSYTRLTGLYDVLFLAERSEADRILTAHYTLAGVEQTTADAFARRFLGALAWK